MKPAFTMVELIFVIIIIGILSVVAVPKLAPVVETAKIGKAKATIATIRSAISTEHKIQTLDGVFTDVQITNDPGRVFSSFTDSGNAVLEHDLKASLNIGDWTYLAGFNSYFYTITSIGGSAKRCRFQLNNNRFELKSAAKAHCKPFLPE